MKIVIGPGRLLVIIAAFLFGLYQAEAQQAHNAGYRSGSIRQFDRVPGMEEEEEGTVYALIVGVSGYKSDVFDSLKFADKDALNFYEFLKSGYLIKKVDTNNIKLLINENANHDSIAIKIHLWLAGLRVKPHDEVYIYWSGHGLFAPDDQKLICQDSDMETQFDIGLPIGAIGMRDIKSRIANFASRPNVRVWLIVDACRKEVEGNTPNNTALRMVRDFCEPGESYFYACSIAESSYESPFLESGNGVFTYFFLKGIQGAADINSDSIVTLSELKSFLSRKVAEYVEKDKRLRSKNDIQIFQIPEIVACCSDETVVLTQLPSEVVIKNKKIIRDLFRSLETEEPHPTPASPAIVRDTGNNAVFKKIRDAVRAGRLIYPAGNSAMDYYRQAQAAYPDGDSTAAIKSLLFSTLFSRARTLIEKYVSGKLEDRRYQTFEDGYQELQAAISLLDGDSIFSRSVQAELLFLKSRALAASNNPADWKLGLCMIDSALKESNHAYLYHTKGILCNNTNRFFSAIRYFDSARIKAPKWTYALYSLASAYLKIQEYDKSIFYCGEVIQQDSAYSKAYTCMAMNWEAISDYRSQYNYKEAIYWNKAAITADPANSNAYFNLGRIYSKKRTNLFRNHDTSIYYYRMGATYNNENCLATIGKLFYEKGPEFSDSVKYYYNRALQVNPFNITTLRSYGITLNTEQCDSFFHDVLHRSGYDYKIYDVYRNFVFVRKSPLMADSIFQKIIQINKEDPYIYIEHSRRYEEIDWMKKAVQVLHQGIDNIPGNPSLYYALAQLYFNNANHPHFVQYALDSVEYYLYKLKTVTLGFSIASYNLYQFFLLQNNIEKASPLLTDALHTNKFARLSNNFLYKSIIAQGDSAVVKRNYKRAQYYYKLAARLDDENMDAKIKIARAYYLAGEPDTAMEYHQKAVSYLGDPEYLTESASSSMEALMILHGLILIEQKKTRYYREAIQVFKELDYYRRYPRYLEQAVCYFLLPNKKMAKQLAMRRPESAAEAYNEIVNGEGTEYSRYFVSQLKAMVAETDGSIFSVSQRDSNKL